MIKGVSSYETVWYKNRFDIRFPVHDRFNGLHSGEDSATGLQWQDDYSDNNGTVYNSLFTGAVIYCERLALDGGGWRLPNQNKLMTIVSGDGQYPSIDNTVFQNTVAGVYWSSTSYYDDKSFGIYASFTTVKSGHEYKTGNLAVRCVRGGSI